MYQLDFDNSLDKKGDNLITISGEVKKILYSNYETGYLVIKLENIESGITYKVVGLLYGVFIGQEINVSGTWEKHSLYGQQLNVCNFEFATPNTIKGIEKYLSSGVIPGIGAVRARLIVNTFKEDAINILDNKIDRLSELPNFGKRLINKIKCQWEKISHHREIIIFLRSIDISLIFCNKIYKEFKDRSVEILKNNPYLLIYRIDGLSFRKVDSIARNLGINYNDKNRIIAIIQYIINNKIVQLGHVCYPEKDFLDLIDLQEFQISQNDLKDTLYFAFEHNLIKYDYVSLFTKNFYGIHKVIYKPQLYNYEIELTEKFIKILNNKCHFGYKIKEIDSNKYSRYNKDQIKAINSICSNPITIITGGPGVGKTTIIKEIVDRAKKSKLKIALTTPTGRASKRLEESTSHKALTIHRLLKWNVKDRCFVYNKNNKLDCNILVVDETSMIDINLFYHLITAIEDSVSIVLIGDIDQLPPIGPGNILRDLINSKMFSVIKLIQIYRQEKENSKIVQNAFLVNKGNALECCVLHRDDSFNFSKSDFYWVRIDNDDPAVSSLIFTIIKKLSELGFNNSKTIQILSSINNGDCGVDALNKLAQNFFNWENERSLKKIQVLNKTFIIADKVIQSKNNYDKGVFNGDIGFIDDIDLENRMLYVVFNGNLKIEYNFDELDEINLAYVITVHKSQGSEFDVVIIPIVNSHYIMLQRNLLYTAITRAKKLLIIVGSNKAVMTSIRNYNTNIRYSGFLYRLRKNKILNK